MKAWHLCTPTPPEDASNSGAETIASFVKKTWSSAGYFERIHVKLFSSSALTAIVDALLLSCDFLTD